MTNPHSLLEQFSRDFLGLRHTDPVCGSAEMRRRIYLDSGATTLMPQLVIDGLVDYCGSANANSHTEAHRAGRDTTLAIEDARDAIGRLVGYDPEHDVVLFTGNGATGAINFLARAIFPPPLRMIIKRFPEGAPAEFVDCFKDAMGAMGGEFLEEVRERPIVVTTRMEHHSNLLPWIEAVGHHNLRAIDVDPTTGALDLAHLERVLDAEGHRVRLIAVTGLSNVTGIVNPIREIARMAHRVGALVAVDGAQWVPHCPVQLHDPDDPEASVDYLAFSGHKLYAPGSRGALVGRLSLLTDRRCVTDVGGGMVDYVSIEDYQLKEEVTAREEAGTPNVLGSIAMGVVAEVLLRIGMDIVEEAEQELTSHLVGRIDRIPGITVYGETDIDRIPRAGVVSFNIDGLHNGLVASYLNDFHNIAVRNGCFCAQPYAKQLILGAGETFDCPGEMDLEMAPATPGETELPAKPGMVRASLGIYSTRDDVESLGAALEELVRDQARILELYEPGGPEGTWLLKDGTRHPATFRISDPVDRWLTSC